MFGPKWNSYITYSLPQVWASLQKTECSVKVRDGRSSQGTVFSVHSWAVAIGTHRTCDNMQKTCADSI